MHAHVVVNNTNLETGARLQDPAPRELMRSAQRLAEERGLSFFADGPGEGAAPLLAARGTRGRERVHFRRAERELAERGAYSWVADIRARVTVARRVARDEADFVAALSELGVEVSGAAPGNGAADWVYALSGEGARRIRGENLGTSFGRRSVLQELALRSSPRRADAIREIARNAVAVDDLDDLRRLADALDAFSREAIRSLADCEARIGALEAAGDFGAMERLAGLRDYAEAKGLLPERAATRRRRPAPDDGSPRTGAARRRGEDAGAPTSGAEGEGKEGRGRHEGRDRLRGREARRVRHRQPGRRPALRRGVRRGGARAAARRRRGRGDMPRHTPPRHLRLRGGRATYRMPTAAGATGCASPTRASSTASSASPWTAGR